jgi:hypothetical protein
VTTAEALEAITDPGSFEILGIRALRHLHPECECLEHMGVNAQGKPIPGPIDGFARVQGVKPSRYIAAAFTTATRNELRRKWYGDGSSSTARERGRKFDTGDLIKACAEAVRLRTAEPGSTFTAYLCTNQRLDDEIMREGYGIGRERSVEVVFVGQSQLRDFLDRPEGQLLREEFLGIRAVNVSRDLLQKLTSASVARYRVDGLSIAGFVETAAWQDARRALPSSAPVLALVGRPGMGKSAIARLLLGRHAENGGIGLWIPGDFLQNALSLNEALTSTLRQFRPYLGEDAGHATLSLGSAANPLLVVLDDPNRTDSPGTILRKIFGWGRNLWSDGTERQGHIKLVVPVWESQFSNLHQDFRGEKWLTMVSVGPMSRRESVACVRNALGAGRTTLSESQLGYIAERLRDDPILLSTFARLSRDDDSIGLNTLLDDVIGAFVGRALADLASTAGRLEVIYQNGLTQLARQMIRRKRLHPEWQEVREWLQPDLVGLLEDIAARGDVCHIAKQGTRDIFEFRHDRILEWQLSRTIKDELSKDRPDWDATCDPYMVQMLGRALANDDVTDAVLDVVEKRLPAGLVAALAFLPTSHSAFSTRLCRRVARRLKDIHLEPPSVQDDVLSILQNTASAHVLTVTEGIARTRPVLCARLRNGDANSGAALLSRKFYPSSNYPWLEGLIWQAASAHADEFAGQLADILRDAATPDETRRGALVLAGYLGSRQLADAIAAAWQYAPHTKESVQCALWAALRCSDPSGDLLATVLPAIFTVSDEPGVGGWSDRNELFQEIGFSARHGFSPDVLSFLKALSERDDRYDPFVSSLFARIDKPICMGYVVRKVAEKAAKPVEPGHVSGVSIWESQWRRTAGFEYAPMPADCVDELWRLCQPENPGWLRRYAFKLWVRYSGDKLWSTEIPPDLSDSDTAVWELAKRGDQRVSSRVAQLLRKDPNHFYGIRGLWSDSFKPALDAALKVGRSAAIRALRDVPADLAEGLIVENWAAIRDRPCGIAAALYIARRSTVDLAQAILRSDPEPAKRLQHIGDYFGFFLHGYSEKITPQHLAVVRELLPLFDDHDLADVTHYCARYGYSDWAQDNLIPVCRRRMRDGDHGFLTATVRQLFPSDSELVSDLDQMVADDERRLDFELRLWADRFNERSDDPSRMPRLLGQWLGNDPPISKFKIAALGIRYQGARRALGVLNRFSSAGNWPLLERFYWDAEYAVMRRSLT